MTTQRDARMKIAWAIHSYWKLYGRAPSLDDVARNAGYRSRGSLYALLAKMRREGLVSFAPRTRRTLRLTPAGEGYAECWPG